MGLETGISGGGDRNREGEEIGEGENSLYVSKHISSTSLEPLPKKEAMIVRVVHMTVGKKGFHGKNDFQNDL